VVSKLVFDLANMLLINQLRLPIDHREDAVPEAIARMLGVRVTELTHCQLYKRATDARRGAVEFSCAYLVTATDEEGILRRFRGKSQVVVAPDETYRQLPELSSFRARHECRPVIVGSGPCGLFCGSLWVAPYHFGTW
jgi:uncharacterized protein